jgi:hypothetical protein
MPNNLLKAIVVDDEKPSREALSTYIRDFCSGDESRVRYQQFL